MTNNTTSSPHLSTKKVAIVILNWNGAKLMEEFLPSVIAYSPAERAEVVVADNGSTDNSIALLQEKFPSVRIIRLDKELWFRRRIQPGTQTTRQRIYRPAEQ